MKYYFHAKSTRLGFHFLRKIKNPNPSPIGKKFGFCACGAPPGTRTLGPLIKRNQKAFFVQPGIQRKSGIFIKSPLFYLFLFIAFSAPCARLCIQYPAIRCAENAQKCAEGKSIPFGSGQGSGQLSKRNSRPARIKAQRAAVLFLSHRSHTAVQHAAHAKGRLDADTSVPCKEQQGIRQLRMEPVQSIIQPKRPSKAWHHVSF